MGKSFRTVCFILAAASAVRLSSAQETVEEIPNLCYSPGPLFEREPVFSSIDRNAAGACELVGDWCQVHVDGDGAAGRLGKIHTGFAQGGEDFRAEFFEGMVPYLKELGAELVRTDPMGLLKYVTVVGATDCEIDWTNADRIVDALAEAGARPLFNFSQCPKEWANAAGFPVNLEAWCHYVQKVVRHFRVERGDPIEYWELWNEPNHHVIDVTPETYCRAYQATVEGIRSVDPAAKVGGPSAAGLDLKWIEALLSFCSDNQVPIDFVSWHNYCLPPWEYPKEIARIREIAAKFPGLGVELVLGEWNVDWREVEINDNEVCGAHALTTLMFLRDAGLEHSMFFEPRDGWDWKGPDRRFWSRWGLLTEKLDRKAGFHAYSLWDRLGENTVPASTSRRNIWSVATKNEDAMRILLWNYPRAINLPKPPPRPREHAGVTLRVRGIPFERWTVTRLLVDRTHSNPYHDLGRESLETVETYEGEGEEGIFYLALAPYAVTLYEIREATAGKIRRNLERISLVPQGFEIFGGLETKIDLTITGTGASGVILAGGGPSPDGVLFEPRQGCGDDPSLLLQPPIVNEPRYVFLNLILMERESAGGPAVSHRFHPCFLLRPAVAIEPLTRRVDVESAGDQATLAMHLSNDSPENLDVSIVTEPPEGWWAPYRSELSISSRDSVRMEIPVRSIQPSTRNPQDSAGTYDVPVSAFLLIGGEERLIERMILRIGIPGVVTYRKGIKVDGDLSDWAGVPEIRFRKERHPQPATEPGDLEPRCFLAWDEDYLYIAADIADDEYVHNSRGGNLWRGDSFTFGMDLLRDADGTTQYGEDDFEWGVALTQDGLESFKWHAAKGHAGGPFGEELLLQIVRDSQGRRYEIGVPWEELTPFEPKAGAKMGINLSVTDEDTGRLGSQDWGNPICRRKNPVGLVPVILRCDG